MAPRTTGLLVFLCLLAGTVRAQLPVPYYYIDDAREISFDTAFIRNQKIQRIYNDNYIREGMTRIKPKGYSNIFAFDKSGKLDTHYVLTRVNILHTDTSVVNVYYTHGQTIYRKKEGDHYKATYQKTDSTGRLMREMICYETNVSNISGVFKLGGQKTLWEESYLYETLSPTQERKKYLNDEGKAYKQTIYYKDDKGRLFEEFTEYPFSGIHNSTKLKFDDYGRIIEKIRYSEETGERTEKNIYFYEKNNRLYRAVYSVNDKRIHEKLYFYNDKSGLLESIMMKSFEGDTIEFINFSYWFSDPALNPKPKPVKKDEPDPKPPVKKGKKPVKKTKPKPAAKKKK